MEERKNYLTLISASMILMIIIFISGIFLQFSEKNIQKLDGVGSITAINEDGIGNTYISGNSDFGYCLIKINKFGIIQWQKTWTGSNYDNAKAICIDSLNNIYITGSTNQRVGYDNDIFILKCNSSGDVLWSRIWGGINEDVGTAISYDSSNNIYIGGTSFDATNTPEMCLIKFDQFGNEIWNSTWGPSDSEGCNALCLDKLNNIYLTGWTEWGGGANIALVKFNNEGKLIWNSFWKRSNLDTGTSITIGADQNVYVGGITYRENSQDTGDVAIIKYDQNGNQIWSQTWGGSQNEACCSIKTDFLGNVIIGGGTITSGVYIYEGKLQNTFFVIYSADGTFLSDYHLKPSDINKCNVMWMGRYHEVILSGKSDTGVDGMIIQISDNSYACALSFLILFLNVLGLISIYFFRFKYPEIKTKKRLKLKQILQEFLLNIEPKYSKVNLDEISSDLKIKNKEFIKNILGKMVQNKKVNGIFFNSTETLAFRKGLKTLENINFPSWIYEDIDDKLLHPESKVKKTILILSMDFDRLQISEIAEVSKIHDEKLIERVIKAMINNKEVYANYFESTKTIAFDLELNLDEIDQLIKMYAKWEQESIKKK